ncbi:MAG: helix-turn-helix transcriptional regulator [Elusimicrobia bacterium]|nr:helix-turn-helix transcriptional regulator [Elusimicrobiota bacterium]
MPRNIYDIVGERIREERKKAGLTIERLAELAQISSSFLAYIETKGRKASLQTIQKLAEAMRIPVARLFDTTPGPGKDAVYAATQQFAQLIRDKTANETAGILEVAKSAAKHLRRN